MPGDTGDVGIDTPDMLPERTAVHDATIELRLPAGCAARCGPTPSSARPTERAEGDDARPDLARSSTTPARRVEDGVPEMDRSVARELLDRRVGQLARALRETMASLDEHEPEVAAWAREAAGSGRLASDARDGRRRRGRRGQGAARIRRGRAQRLRGRRRDGRRRPTARTFLASHDGSRSWLIVRALRELGIAERARRRRERPVQRRPGVPPALRALHPPARSWRTSTARTCGSTPTSRARRCPPAASRPSSAAASRSPPTGRIAPLPATRRATTSATRSTCASRSTRSGDARGHLRHHPARTRRAGARRGAREDRRRRAAARAPRRRARVAPVGERRRGAARVERGQLAGEPARRRERRAATRRLEGAKTWLLPGHSTRCTRSSPRARVSSLGATFATRAGRGERARPEPRRPVPRPPPHRAARGRDRVAHARAARGEGEARRGVAAHRGRDADRPAARLAAPSSRTTSSSASRPAPSRPRTTGLRLRRPRRRRRLPGEHPGAPCPRSASALAGPPSRPRRPACGQHEPSPLDCRLRHLLGSAAVD